MTVQPWISDSSSLQNRAVLTRPAVKHYNYADTLSLNLAPIRFSSEQFEAGCTAYQDEDQYRALREAHQATHAFRFDARDSTIYDIPMTDGAAPLGKTTVVDTQDHLNLLGKAVNHAILAWLSPRRTILRRARPLLCWGNRKAALLSAAIRDRRLTVTPGLDVLIRHSFDPRVLNAPNHTGEQFLALLLDVSTSNEINIPVSQLLLDGFDPMGCYVCTRQEHSEDNVLSRLETLGLVVGHEGGRVQLSDCAGDEYVDADSVTLEPRQENLDSLIRHYYPRDAEPLLAGLRHRRHPYASANGKLNAIREVHAGIAARLGEISIAGMRVESGALLQRGDRLFPQQIATDRPGFLFGAQGRETGAYPDQGVKRHGPYKYMQQERNEPVIAVICESRFRGRIDQLARTLRDGIMDDAWRDAMLSRANAPDNPFQGGMIGKLRLSSVHFEFEEVSDPTPDAYRAAIERLLARLPETPDLALVQIRADFKQLRNDRNPYFAAKAAFMTVGVPVQSIQAETADMRPANLAYVANNLALASYAKLGGTPFVILTRMPATHELVVGLGCTEISEGRFGPKSRFSCD